MKYGIYFEFGDYLVDERNIFREGLDAARFEQNLRRRWDKRQQLLTKADGHAM